MAKLSLTKALKRKSHPAADGWVTFGYNSVAAALRRVDGFPFRRFPQADNRSQNRSEQCGSV